MKFREDRGEIGATWEEQVLEGTYSEREENSGTGCIECEVIMICVLSAKRYKLGSRDEQKICSRLKANHEF